MLSETVLAAAANASAVGALVAERHLEGDIAGVARPHRRRAGLERIERADHVGQRLPIDRDRLGGVLGLLDGIGDDEGDGVADMADHVARQHRIGRRVDLDAFGDGDAGQRAERGDIRRGKHEVDAGQPARHRDIGDGESAHGHGASAAPPRAVRRRARHPRHSGRGRG